VCSAGAMHPAHSLLLLLGPNHSLLQCACCACCRPEDIAIVADPPAAEHVIAHRWRLVQHARTGDARTGKRAQHADTGTADSRKHAGGIRCQRTPATDMHARPQTWPARPLIRGPSSCCFFAGSVLARLRSTATRLTGWEEQVMQLFILRRHIQVCAPSDLAAPPLPHPLDPQLQKRL